MTRHQTIAGYLMLGWGVVILFVALLISLGLIGGAAAAPDAGVASALSGAGTLVGLLLVMLSLVVIAGGWGFARGLSWARPLMWIASVFALISFPIGTAIGIYAIWALVQTTGTHRPAGAA